MNPIEIVVLILAGFLSGFINTVAGGGSIISLSLLMFLGMPPSLANGTNRVSILLQSFTATSFFKSKKVLDTKKGIWLAVPAVIGSVIGAQIAADISPQAFKISFGIILLVIGLYMLFEPTKFIHERKDIIDSKVTPVQIGVFFLIGLYGGYIQAGVGYLLLPALVLMAGYNLLKANALKVLVVFLFTPFALIVFILNGQVDFVYGLIMSVGTILGAYLASHLAIKKGSNFIRWLVIAFIVISALDMFNVLSIRSLL